MDASQEEYGSPFLRSMQELSNSIGTINEYIQSLLQGADQRCDFKSALFMSLFSDPLLQDVPEHVTYEELRALVSVEGDEGGLELTLVRFDGSRICM